MIICCCDPQTEQLKKKKNLISVQADVLTFPHLCRRVRALLPTPDGMRHNEAETHTFHFATIYY